MISEGLLRVLYFSIQHIAKIMLALYVRVTFCELLMWFPMVLAIQNHMKGIPTYATFHAWVMCELLFMIYHKFMSFD